MTQMGLNIPIITALDDAGNIIESDQRNIIHHTIQQGRGADSLFISGTTGEFNRISNKQRQQLLAICIEEVRCANSLLPEKAEAVEAWAGVTAFSKAETIQNLDLARQLKADMAVISPLTIADLSLSEIVDFFKKDVAGIVGSEKPLEIGLYDNPDINAPDKPGNIPVAIIKELQKLPFIVCLKASTSKEVLQNYIGEFSVNDHSPGFLLYFGNAGLIFDMDEMHRCSNTDPTASTVAGVVSGTANLFPREWKKAWNLATNYEIEKFDVFRWAFNDFEKLTTFEEGRVSKLIGGIKQAMHYQGIISSPCVAGGTAALTDLEAQQLNEGLERVLSEMRSTINPQFLSVYEESVSCVQV